MRSRTPRTGRVALIDTGFWLAFFEQGDAHHQHALDSEAALLGFRSVLCPWPILYETLNTWFTRRRDWLPKFNAFLKRGNVILLDDSKYREEALRDTFVTRPPKGRGLSLVDRVLHLIIEDRNVGVECLFTYDVADFQELCSRHRVVLHSHWEMPQ